MWNLTTEFTNGRFQKVSTGIFFTKIQKDSNQAFSTNIVYGNRGMFLYVYCFPYSVDHWSVLWKGCFSMPVFTSSLYRFGFFFRVSHPRVNEFMICIFYIIQVLSTVWRNSGCKSRSILSTINSFSIAVLYYNVVQWWNYSILITTETPTTKYFIIHRFFLVSRNKLFHTHLRPLVTIWCWLNLQNSPIYARTPLFLDTSGKFRVVWTTFEVYQVLYLISVEKVHWSPTPICLWTEVH